MDEKVKEEWSRLKQLVSGMAGEQRDGQRIAWRPSGLAFPDSLWLEDVVASFHDGKDVRAHIHIRRRPPAAGKTWLEKSPVPLVTWSLEPAFEGNAFAWQIRELSEPDDPSQAVNIFHGVNDGQVPSETISTDFLAIKVRDRLIEHHRKYEMHYKELR
jgi:hypothetical protein